MGSGAGSSIRLGLCASTETPLAPLLEPGCWGVVPGMGGGVMGSLGIKSKCRGWAWGLILLPWDAEPHLGNGLIFQKTNGTQKTESHIILKGVDSGARLPTVFCEMHALGCELLNAMASVFSSIKWAIIVPRRVVVGID